MEEKSKLNYIKYTKAIIIGVVIILLLFSAIFYYFYQLAYNNQLQSFIAQQQLYLKIVTGNFNRRLEVIIENIYNIYLKNVSSERELSNSLQLHALPEIRYMAVVEKTGVVKELNNKFSDLNLEKLNSEISNLVQNNWDKIKGNYYIPKLQISKEKQLMLVFYPLKLFGQKKIIVSAVDLSVLAQNYIEPIKLNKSGVSYLIDGQGRVVYDYVEEIIGASVFELHQDYEKLLAVDKKMINTHSGTDSYNFIERETGEQSKKHISWQTIRLGSNQLVLAISTPEDDIVTGIKSLRNKLIILTSVIFAVLILAGYSFYRFNKQRLVNILKDLQEDYDQQTERLQILSEIVEQSDDSIMQTDTAGNIEYVNSATEELFGWSREELIGKNPQIFNAEESSDEVQAEIFSTLAREGIYENEILNQRKDGSTFWCQLKTIPLINSSGETYAYMGIQRNITEQIEREERLKEAKEEAEVANQAKSEFLANMSHEIRTPLNAVIGFSDLLTELVESNQQQEYVTAIKTSGQTLLTLINDILDLSKIESGNLEKNYDYFNLEQLIRDLEQIFSKKIKEKDLKFIIDLKSELPLVKLDKIRTRQILLNLVGNAVKFTEEGYIKIVVDIKEQNKEKLTLYLFVEDTGIGITEDKQGEVFKSFRQGDNKLNKEYEGTGLGLAITKSLTEIMDGIIEVDSQVGIGSTFKLQFEAVEYKHVKSKTNEEPKYKNINLSFQTAKILVVDDISSNLKLIEAILENEDLTIVTASDGKSALEILAEEKFDLVLLDIKLPDLDGYQILEKMYKEGLNQSTTAIALTASATKKELKKIKQSSFVDFMTKPIQRQKFLNLIANHLTYNASQDKKVVKKTNRNNRTKDSENKKNNRQGLSELVTKLESDFVVQAKDLEELFIINKAEEFARKLYKLALQYDNLKLEKYADELKQNLEIFNVEKSKTKLSQFEEIIDSLKEHYD